MDNAGLLDIYPLLRLLLMSVSPTWGRQMIKKPQQATQDEISATEQNLLRNLCGLETNYRKGGGNPQLRLQRIQQLLGMAALDEQGQPITNPQTGQPMPGRVARIYQNNPDVKALVDDTMKNEWFLATQQSNAEIGRTGVKAVQGQGNG
jgi:hypothetical protein